MTDQSTAVYRVVDPATTIDGFDGLRVECDHDIDELGLTVAITAPNGQPVDALIIGADPNGYPVVADNVFQLRAVPDATAEMPTFTVGPIGITKCGNQRGFTVEPFDGAKVGRRVWLTNVIDGEFDQWMAQVVGFTDLRHPVLGKL